MCITAARGLGVLLAIMALSVGGVKGQELATADPVLATMWGEGMERSQAHRLAQTLMDSLGPRLTGSPESEAASGWIVETYRGWGIDARREPYGTWRGWRRGVTHADLVRPRVQTLDATMLAWSPGTAGVVEGPVLALPEPGAAGEFAGFLERVDGAFVLLSPPEPTCRPDVSWEAWALEESIARLEEERSAAEAAWERRLAGSGLQQRELLARLEEAGAAGILTSRWSEGWGVQKIFGANTTRVPTLDVSCEDYGLLARLALNGQGPVVRVRAEAEDLGEVPVWNTIGVLRGVELPDEYVVLSAHFDSWDGATGATDNGTGTAAMMEAMRILSETYPNPRRTILVGHWNGEEQGLIGSRAFVADHPEVVEGVQAAFNLDHGTGRVTRIAAQGLTGVAPYLAGWMTAIPREISRHVTMVTPGMPATGGSDNASFACAGAPVFGMGSLDWDYGTYTWHTNRDTFDKVVMDEVRNNATLTAMLAYLASEEPDRLPRARRILPPDRQTGAPAAWPTCRDGARSSR